VIGYDQVFVVTYTVVVLGRFDVAVKAPLLVGIQAPFGKHICYRKSP
jgi:hypothetical protein